MTGTVAGSPTVSVIVPVGALGADAAVCIGRIVSLLGPGDACIAALDGIDWPADPPPGCRVVRQAVRSGPAFARNFGAGEAGGDVLFFVDADVLLAPDAVERVRAFFAERRGDAVFGSYDDAPAAPGPVSQFRNLLHHFQHHRKPGPTTSFWTGCGAVRRAVFDRLGGFSRAYRAPALEDVEFGTRLAAAGMITILDPDLRCKHLKRWTLASMVRADLFERAIPWARLIYGAGAPARVLNADGLGALSLALTAVTLCSLVLSLTSAWFLALAAASWLGLLFSHGTFLALLWRRGGIGLAVAGSLLLPVHLAVGGMGFLWVTFERLGVVRRARDNAA